MTLWMVLLVVGVAWISGALFGWGSRELLSQHRRAAADKIWARKQAAEASTDAKTDLSMKPASEPVADAAARTHRFWIAPDDAPRPAEEAVRQVNPPEALTTEPRAPEPAAVETPKTSAPPVETPAAAGASAGVRVAAEPPRPEPAKTQARLDLASAVEKPAERPAVEPAKAPTDKQIGTSSRSARASTAALRAPSGPRTVASVQADPNDPDNQPAKPRRRYVDPPKGSDYWRLLDKRSQRPPLTFWLEISVLLVLLSAVAWAVVYFATQPVMGVFM